MMKIDDSLYAIILFSLIIVFCGCSSPMSFEDQIKKDIETKMASGICDSIPKGSIISGIEIGEIVDIGMEGMTDVSIKFDYEHNGKVDLHESALLYIKRGSRYTLAAMGGCEYDMK